MTDPHPDRDEVLAWFARKDESDAKRAIVERYDPLARSLAKRFTGRGIPLDDLEQVARYAMLNAIERFDADRGVKFATYAGRTIIGELKRHLRDQAWSLRVPRSLHDLWLETGRAIDTLTQRLARNPTIQEIADELDEDVAKVIEALEAGSAFTAGSLDTPLTDTGDVTLADVLGDIDAALEAAGERSTLSEHVMQLPDRERTVLYLRFFEGKTQSEIAEVVGVSQVHVGRILAGTLDQLRDAIRPDPAE